jgi:hypothetical protein
MRDAGDGASPGRARTIFAAVLAAGLLAAAAVVAIGSAGGDPGVPEPDAECLELWNSDPLALAYGVHNFKSHDYYRVEVLRLEGDGRAAAPGEGACAVVFAASTLDAEPIAAAQILIAGSWTPLSEVTSVSDERLAELQSDAVGGSNATLEETGALSSSA